MSSLGFPPRDAGSGVVNSSGRVWVGPGIYVHNKYLICSYINHSHDKILSKRIK